MSDSDIDFGDSFLEPVAQPLVVVALEPGDDVDFSDCVLEQVQISPTIA